jgi:hypothetical protein
MFSITDHGSLVLVRPLTDDCRAWLEANVSDESQWFGGALVVEPRYLIDLVAGLADEGFAAT